MNIKNIVILLVIAAIFAAIAFTLIQENPGIEKVIISEDANIGQTQPEPSDNTKPQFSKDTQLYAIIFIKNAKPEDIINIRWLVMRDGKEELVQENRVTLKNEEGSGRIAVSLSKKNNTNIQGDYIVNVTFNDKETQSGFVIE